jgi:hypothetical protein
MAIVLDGSGTISGLNADGLASQPVFPGNVLQVVQASTSTEVVNSTTTYTDTGLTATITPKSASSKILVLVSQSCAKSGAAAGNGVNMKLFRGATDLGITVFRAPYTPTSLTVYAMSSFEFLDTPSTTAATTYKTQFANIANAASVSVQPDSGCASTITLMEIAG